jgi:hypothetical protein
MLEERNANMTTKLEVWEIAAAAAVAEAAKRDGNESNETYFLF